MTGDAVIEQYLSPLDRAAAELPADSRQDLVDGIREHIADARAAGAAADEAAVRTLLDRLGAPEEIVAAAREDDVRPVDAATRPATRPGTGLELAAVLMLTAGSFLPVVGWLVGVGLLWTSRLWRAREKVLGTLVVPLGPGGALLLGGPLSVLLARSEACTSTVTSQAGPPSAPGFDVGACQLTGPPEWVLPAVVAVLLVAPVVVAVVLLRAARRRAEHPATASQIG